MKVTTIAIAALLVVVGAESTTASLLKLKGSDSTTADNTKQLLRHRGLENKGKGEGPEGLPEKANTDNNGVNGLFQVGQGETPGEGTGEGQGAENGQGNGVTNFSFSDDETDDNPCRLLQSEPIEEDVPLHRRIELIRNLNAKDDASYSVKHNLISTKSCDALIQHIEVAHDHDVDSGVELPTSGSEHAAEVEESETYTAFNGGVENQYNQKLSADKLVSLIGKDETKKLIDYFYESLGNLNINSMVLIRHGLPTDGHYDIGWHTDNCETVEVTLNDDYEGGRLLHLNVDGVHKTDTRTGTAIAHSDDVVHGLPSNSAIRYTLVLKHYPGMDDYVKLSPEIMNNMN